MAINADYSNYNDYYRKNYFVQPNSYNNVTKPTFVNVEQASVDTVEFSKSSSCKDGKDDGSIGFWEATKNVLKGGVKFVTGMFTDENGDFSLKQTLKTVGMGVAIGLATMIPVVGPLVLPALCIYGMAHGGTEVLSGISKAMDATTDAEAEQAWQQVGSGATEGTLSYVGYKATGGIKKAWAESKADFAVQKAKWSKSTNTAAEPKAELRLESKAEAKAEPKAEAKAEPKAEAKAEPKAEAKAEPKAEAKAEPKAEAKVKAEAEAKAKAEAEAKVKAEAEAKAKAEAEAKAKAEAEAKAKAEAEAKVKAEAEAKAKAEAEAKAKAEAEAKAKAEAEAKAAEMEDVKEYNIIQKTIKKNKELNAQVDEIMSRPDFNTEELLNTKLNMLVDGNANKPVSMTFNEYVESSIKGDYSGNVETLYHGTKSKLAYNDIMENGFDLKAMSRGENGRAVYTGQNGSAIDSVYGKGGVVKMNYKGGKIADLGTRTFGVKRDLISMDFYNLVAKNTGMDICDKNLTTIAETILDRLFVQKLQSMGYDGVHARTYNSSCDYIAVFDPKHLEIIK